MYWQQSSTYILYLYFLTIVHLFSFIIGQFGCDWCWPFINRRNHTYPLSPKPICAGTARWYDYAYSVQRRWLECREDDARQKRAVKWSSTWPLFNQLERNPTRVSQRDYHVASKSYRIIHNGKASDIPPKEWRKKIPGPSSERSFMQSGLSVDV